MFKNSDKNPLVRNPRLTDRSVISRKAFYEKFELDSEEQEPVSTALKLKKGKSKNV